MATELDRDVLPQEEDLSDQDRAILAALSSLFNPPNAEEVGAEAWSFLRNLHHHGQFSTSDREVLVAVIGALAYAQVTGTVDRTFRNLFDFGPAPTRRVAMLWKDALERGRRDRQSA